MWCQRISLSSSPPPPSHPLTRTPSSVHPPISLFIFPLPSCHCVIVSSDVTLASQGGRALRQGFLEIWWFHLMNAHSLRFVLHLMPDTGLQGWCGRMHNKDSLFVSLFGEAVLHHLHLLLQVMSLFRSTGDCSRLTNQTSACKTWIIVIRHKIC